MLLRKIFARRIDPLKETTAHNVVQLALQEFGMGAADSSSLEWSLTEVSVTCEGVIKQKRLPDQMQNLAERIALNSRYSIALFI